ncbi:taste receptor type 2 member 41-like [Pelodytes ibericus]
MFRPITIVIIAFDLVALMASVPGNLFILLVMVLGRPRKDGLPTTELLILGISTCSLIHGFLKTITYLIIFMERKFSLVDEIQKGMTVLFLTIMSCNLWFGTWLCMHFCLKIVNINQKVYMILQSKFNKIIPFLILQSVLGSFIMSLPVAWNDIPQDPPNSTLSAPLEMIISFTLIVKPQFFCYLPIYCAISSVAFLMFSFSALTIITSLYRHRKHMQDNAQCQRSPNLEAHVRATKIVSSLLSLTILYFLSIVLALFNRQNFNWLHFSSFLISIFHLIGSFALINGNIKLRKAIETLLTFLSAKIPCDSSFT